MIKNIDMITDELNQICQFPFGIVEYIVKTLKINKNRTICIPYIDSEDSEAMYCSYNDIVAAITISFSRFYHGDLSLKYIDFDFRPRILDLNFKDPEDDNTKFKIEKIKEFPTIEQVVNLEKILEILLFNAKLSDINRESYNMPDDILIMTSDLSLDKIRGLEENLDHIKELYDYYNYNIPKITFWNINSHNIFLKKTILKKNNLEINEVNGFY